jgi:hypothetical protein
MAGKRVDKVPDHGNRQRNVLGFNRLIRMMTNPAFATDEQHGHWCNVSYRDGVMACATRQPDDFALTAFDGILQQP